jgi:hypothetical protein
VDRDQRRSKKKSEENHLGEELENYFIATVREWLKLDKTKMTNAIKGLVSKKKKRYKDGEFNLDLSCKYLLQLSIYTQPGAHSNNVCVSFDISTGKPCANTASPPTPKKKPQISATISSRWAIQRRTLKDYIAITSTMLRASWSRITTITIKSTIYAGKRNINTIRIHSK